MSFRKNVITRYGRGVLDMINDLEKSLVKDALYSNHLTFLIRCKNYGLLPKGLRLKVPLFGDKAKEILREASRKLLLQAIGQARVNKFRCRKKIEELSEQLKICLNRYDSDLILKSLWKKRDRVMIRKKCEQLSKFSRLMSERNHVSPNQDCNIDNSKFVINLSDRPLSETEQYVLSKGLNFGLASNGKCNLDYVVPSELAASLLPAQEQDFYRSTIRQTLDKHKPPKLNLSSQEWSSLSALRTDSTVIFLPADKGRATVVMNKVNYDCKLNDLLNGGEYALLNKNPTVSIQNKVKEVLKNNKEFFSKSLMFKLSPQYSKAPHLYGLPKLHKPEVPLRPIVSSMDSPTYQLSSYLLPILTPLFGNSETFVQNSECFLEKLRLVDVNVGKATLVSYDVTSLFTNVPVSEMLSIVRDKLQSDSNLIDRTLVPVSSIMELLDVCVRNSYFQVEGNFYKQIEGLPMGGVLSPILSNIYMDEFERIAKNTFDKKPKCWFRYLDDVFCIWEDARGVTEEFLTHLNSLRPSIKFTMETENEGRLPFLDVLITKQDNKLVTTVYRKPTNTGQYLNYKSNHANSVKLALAQGLFKRAITYCSEESDRQAEVHKVFIELQGNGYPDTVLKKALGKALKNKNYAAVTETVKPITTMVIPYVAGLSETVRRINKKFGIRTAFKCKKDLRSVLTKVRPSDGTNKSKNVVYKIPCSCGGNYYGQTSRPAEVRIGEHKKLLSKADPKNSKIVEHVISTQHNVNWPSSCIVLKEDRWKERNILEAACMAVDNNSISQPSASLHPMFVPLIQKEVQVKINNGKNVYPPPPPTSDNTDNAPVNSVVSRRSERLRGRKPTYGRS